MDWKTAEETSARFPTNLVERQTSGVARWAQSKFKMFMAAVSSRKGWAAGTMIRSLAFEREGKDVRTRGKLFHHVGPLLGLLDEYIDLCEERKDGVTEMARRRISRISIMLARQMDK